MNNFFKPITFSTYIDAPVDRVYEALTTSEGWDGWFTKGATIDLPEKHIHFVWRDLGPDKINDEASAKIIDYKKNELFSFAWHGDSLDHPTLVTIRLEPKVNGTKLTVTDEGYPKTPKGEHMYMDCSAGWGEAMTLLKIHLETCYQYRNWPTQEQT